MKNKFLAFLLITGTILTLTSCASRKYGCPATAHASTEIAAKHKV